MKKESFFYFYYANVSFQTKSLINRKRLVYMNTAPFDPLPSTAQTFYFLFYILSVNKFTQIKYRNKSENTICDSCKTHENLKLANKGF